MNENEKAIEKLKMIRKQYNRYEITHSIDLAIKALEERPTGKWIMITEHDGFMHSKCSNCNQFNAWGDVTFCPWCGAKMERSEEE